MDGSWFHPARLLPLAFLAAIGVTTVLLMLPAARADPTGHTGFVTALFTATSAICVTGLTVVGPDHWSGFGQLVILAALHLGGFGIMTAATLLALLVVKRLGLRMRMLAATEGRALDLANVRGVLVRVALLQLAFEAAVALPLTLRWWLGYRMPLPEAAWHGVFHGVSAFNNGGFSLYPDSMARFVGDAWIVVPLALGVVAGSLGFPVLIEVGRRIRHRRRWSVHTLLTLAGTAVLLVVGFGGLLAAEWGNPATLGRLDTGDKLLAGFFQAVMPRSGGFSTVDVAGMRTESIALQHLLMFIGGGSASTAGGIKIATFFLIAAVIWSELRGEPDVVVAGRRIASAAQREAVSVAVLSIAVIAAGVLAVTLVTDGFSYEHVMFDVISAFGTVGLTTGVTAASPPAAQLVLAAVMFVGRLGPVVVGTAVALNTRHRRYRLPEERPLVG